MSKGTFLKKVGIVLGSAYFMYQVDVWSLISEETKRTYDKFTGLATPVVKAFDEKVTKELQGKIIGPREMKRRAGYKYNDLVNRSFDFIETIPKKVSNVTSVAIEFMREYEVVNDAFKLKDSIRSRISRYVRKSSKLWNAVAGDSKEGKYE